VQWRRRLSANCLFLIAKVVNGRTVAKSLSHNHGAICRSPTLIFKAYIKKKEDYFPFSRAEREGEIDNAGPEPAQFFVFGRRHCAHIHAPPK
jgi:hypothetical protein